jgi:hypothetical protein
LGDKAVGDSRGKEGKDGDEGKNKVGKHKLRWTGGMDGLI